MRRIVTPRQGSLGALAVASLVSIPACDYWHRVEVRNALREPIDVQMGTQEQEFIQVVGCDAPSSPGDYASEVGFRVAPQEARCVSGANGWRKYQWSDIRGVVMEIHRSGDVCATLDGAAVDRATDDDGRLVVDETLCP